MRLISLVASFAALTCLSATPSRAGLFDFLFQSSGQHNYEIPAGGYYQPDMRRRPPKRHRVVVVPKHNSEAVAFDKSDLAKDPTLRNGDAVMTEKGLRIVANSGEYGAKTLVPIASTKGLPQSELKALAAAVAAAKPAAAQTVTGRSATISLPTVAWKWIRDARGQTIRYVGP